MNPENRVAAIFFATFMLDTLPAPFFCRLQSRCAGISRMRAPSICALKMISSLISVSSDLRFSVLRNRAS